jgi:hypothetical protein
MARSVVKSLFRTDCQRKGAPARRQLFRLGGMSISEPAASDSGEIDIAAEVEVTFCIGRSAMTRSPMQIPALALGRDVWVENAALNRWVNPHPGRKVIWSKSRCTPHALHSVQGVPPCRQEGMALAVRIVLPGPWQENIRLSSYCGREHDRIGSCSVPPRLATVREARSQSRRSPNTWPIYPTSFEFSKTLARPLVLPLSKPKRVARVL